MKVISKETGKPAVEFGDKIKVKEGATGRYGDAPEGSVGIVVYVSSDTTYTPIKVYVKTDGDIEYDCFNADDLEVLRKFNGDPVEKEQSVTVELTLDDIKHITAALHETESTTTADFFKEEYIDMPEGDNVDVFLQFEQLLTEVA